MRCSPTERSGYILYVCRFYKRRRGVVRTLTVTVNRPQSFPHVSRTLSARVESLLSVLPLFRTSYPHANRRVGQHLQGEEPWVFPSPLSRPSVKQPLSRRDSHGRVHRLHDSTQAKWVFAEGIIKNRPRERPKLILSLSYRFCKGI